MSGIEVEDGTAAVVGALVLGFANAFTRPILVVLTLPITFLALGLFVWVVNVFMLKLTAAFVPGFKVEGFGARRWWAACSSEFSTSRFRCSSGSRNAGGPRLRG